jgi:hypothetical protein
MRWAKPTPTVPIPESVDDAVTLIEMTLYQCAEDGINPIEILQALLQFEWPPPRQPRVVRGYSSTLPEKFEGLCELAGEWVDGVASCWGIETEELLRALSKEGARRTNQSSPHDGMM